MGALGKRALDVCASFAGLVLLAPAGVAIAAAIRVESPGAAIFRQMRVGHRGHPFVLYKFRSMRSDTGDLPTHLVSTQALTSTGAFLRRTKLDELPQLWNVLRGEMSLVGPRPCLPSQLELIAERERCGALNVRPGITGPAQLAGIDMSQPVRLAEADGTYAAEHSLIGDLGLIFRTVAGGGSGDQTRPVSRAEPDP